MRRLIPTLAAGLLAGGTVLTGGIASAGTTAGLGHGPSAARLISTCTNIGSFYFNVTQNGVNYYLGRPKNPTSGTAVFLKPTTNGTTSWNVCELASNPSDYVVSNGTLAMTSRATTPGTDVTLETTGNGGSGYSSQQWTIIANGPNTITFQNVKTLLYLRVHNSGPSMGQDVTTGGTSATWTYQ